MNRNSILKRNISLGFSYKIIGMGLSYISVPITLNYLGEKNYGVWILIFSILSWINNFDLGIGNGLRTKLTEAFSKGEKKEAKEYISTSYFVLGLIAIVFFLLGILMIYFIDIQKIFNINFIPEIYLKRLLLLTFIFILSNFTVGLYKALLYSIHKSSWINLINILYQFLIIIGIFFLKQISHESLIGLSIVYGLSNLIVGTYFTYIFFKDKKDVRPSFKYIKLKKFRSVGGLGLGFFVIQLCSIVIYSTDNLIISRNIGTSSVTSYSMVMKLFNTVILIWYIISAPLWSLYTDAYAKKDIKWIKNTLKKLNILFIGISIGTVGLIYLAPPILKIWLRKDLEYPKYIFIFFTLFVLIRIYGDIYMSFLNAIGKIKNQMIFSIIGAILNIPLSIFFIKKLNLESSGVILATILCLLPLTVTVVIETYKIIKENKLI